MGDKALGVKHNLSLSNRVWGELKLRAVQENTTVSELIAFILERYITDPPKKITVSRYQTRETMDGNRTGRTVYIPDAIWLPAEQSARQGGFSITNLVDLLAKDYLGIILLEREPDDSSERDINQTPTLEQKDHNQYVRIGDKTIDLGENPLSLDLKTGEVTKRQKPK